ncbi:MULTISPECIES: DLW-39 family protein [Mumia]|nr:DLW-39 family protein [Mumia sp. ZJ430]
MKKLVIAAIAAAGLFAVVNKKKKAGRNGQQLWAESTDKV